MKIFIFISLSILVVSYCNAISLSSHILDKDDIDQQTETIVNHILDNVIYNEEFTSCQPEYTLDVYDLSEKPITPVLK